MNPWIQEKQYPILSVAEIFGSEWTKIFLQTASENWTVPLTHQVYINLKRILPTFCLWEQKHFLTTCYNSEHSRFIIINRQQTGYYRVHYDLESWLGIINYLNSENYTNINVLNRAQIIDDTFHLAISGKLNFYVFWDVVSYLKWETDYIPWYSMFKAAEYISHILPFYNADNIIFKEKLQMQLGSLLQKIGYEEESNDDMFIKCLRQEALRWACILGDSKCKKHAEYKLQWHLLNPIKNKLLPWWREWTFCNGLCVSSIYLDQVFIDLDKMNITKLIKLLLYGSLLNYVMALYQHKENVFDKFKINNDQINKPKTTRTRRSEVTKITKEITSNATHSYIHQMSVTVRVRLVNPRLPDFIKPKRYEIELTLETGENIFYGECCIMIMILKATQNINLHSANLEITEVILTGKIDKYVIVEKARDISYIHELQIVVLDFSEVLRPGNYTLSITYKGVIANDGGFVKVSYINAIREKK
ncbi:hypothetical protein P5V15_004950 [Pogonomyrmex californicus]